jgi:hypothetical protein
MAAQAPRRKDQKPPAAAGPQREVQEQQPRPLQKPASDDLNQKSPSIECQALGQDGGHVDGGHVAAGGHAAGLTRSSSRRFQRRRWSLQPSCEKPPNGFTPPLAPRGSWVSGAHACCVAFQLFAMHQFKTDNLTSDVT